MIDDIRYLIVFAKIAETGSVSGGAEALGLSAATASLHLSRLERNLGRALLYRNSRKLSLTQDGTQLLDTARSMLELYEKGFIEFRQRAVSTRNSLRISMPAVFVNGDFTRHLAAFIEEHPDLDLGIACDDSRHDIIGDGIDIAFRIGDLPDSSLKARHLFLLPRQVVAAPAFLARHAPLEHPRDLQRLEWIGLGMRPDSRLFRHARHQGRFSGPGHSRQAPAGAYASDRRRCSPASCWCSCRRQSCTSCRSHAPRRYGATPVAPPG